jgi:nicotinamide riboside transporter PnuC
LSGQLPREPNLALLGAISAGVAAVNQQPKRPSSWVALVASVVGLLALLLASLPVTGYS